MQCLLLSQKHRLKLAGALGRVVELGREAQNTLCLGIVHEYAAGKVGESEPYTQGHIGCAATNRLFAMGHSG